ncbi:MAG: type II secretion system protein [Clostridium sp.]
MKKVSRKSKKGFTLVELLVVIGIIGILAAIILPRFTGYTEKAIMKETTTQARSAYTYIASYYAENGKYPDDVTVDQAGITKKKDDTVLLKYDTTKKDGSFEFTLTRGTKTYKVTYNDKGEMKELPPA